MPLILLTTPVAATPEVLFDLSINVDVHQSAAGRTAERAVAGVLHGPMRLGDTVTWRARHFGVWQQLTSKITAYNRPHRFVDEQVQGIFRQFHHEHVFEPTSLGTLMHDRLVYTSPLGPLGHLADVLFLKRYLTRFLIQRNRVLKQLAEAG